MAEGGFGFGPEDPIGQGSDKNEPDADTTTPFEPGTASTPYQTGDPYHRGEEIEMSSFPHEKSSQPDTSTDETSFGREETPLLKDLIHTDEQENFLQNKLAKIKAWRPKVDFSRIGLIGFGKKPANQSRIVAFGPQGGETPVFLKGETGLQKKFLDSFSTALGPRAAEIIAEDRDTIREESQRLRESEIQLQQAETLRSQREEVKEKIEATIKQRMEIQDKIDEITDKYGSNLESEQELNRLKQQKKIVQTNLENQKKVLASLTKKTIAAEKQQAKVDRLRASLTAKTSERDALEERLNQTKPLDDLKEEESKLQRQNEEDLAIIQDENRQRSEKQDAEGRVAQRNQVITRLQTQIAEREMERPLLERVKEIFKKYGITLTAILLTAGTTIGAVIGVLTRSLKATGKVLGNGLKDIGAKLGSILPGLIGSIVSFLFKAAGQVVGFLAEHTWLLLLAAVAFLFDHYLKKRRD